MLLKDIQFSDGQNACNHLWFTAKRSFLKVKIEESAIIEVTGVVSCYRRKDGSYDYGIENYSKVQIVKQGHGIVPAKAWTSSGYDYFKFIADDGT